MNKSSITKLRDFINFLNSKISTNLINSDFILNCLQSVANQNFPRSLINISSFDSRFLINAKKYNYVNSLFYELNGVILLFNSEQKKFILLSKFLPRGQLNYNTTFLKNLTQDNKIIKIIFPILNMTYISLYYFNKKWNIATKNNIDANNTIYISKTFLQLFNETIANITNELFDYSILNINKTYIFAFQHPEIQIFNKYALYLVDSFITDNEPIDEQILTGEKNLTEEKKITEEKNLTEEKKITGHELTLEKFATADSISEKHVLVDSTDILLSFLKIPKLPVENTTKWELKDYSVFDIIKDDTLKITNNIDTSINMLKFPLYACGAIIYCNEKYYYMRTAFYKFLHNYVYSYPKNIPKNKITNYLILRANLSYMNGAYFLKLFPQFRADYAKYTEIKLKIIDHIIEKHKKTKKQYDKLLPEQIKINKLAEYFINKFTGVYAIDYNLIDCKKILYDWISDLSNLPILFKILQ